MNTLPTVFPRVPLKKMEPAMLWFELDRETTRLMPEARELITSAATMASFLHRNQTRMVRGDLPRTPYIEHPLRVALRLIRWGVSDAALVAAALLHDVVEDCAEELLEFFGADGESALDCLARLYGSHVAELVAAVTNPEACDRSAYTEHVAQLATSGSPALIIKASDLEDNAGSIRHQLGHGVDEKMLRLLHKYVPVVSMVAAGVMSRDREFGLGHAAADDMDRLATDLRQLAVETGVANS